MNCPHCGSANTRVANTATPDKDTRATHSLIAKAAGVIGWWDPTDYRVRRRKCLRKSCAKRFDTVELEVGSLADAIDDARKPRTFQGMLRAIKPTAPRP